MSVPFAKRNDWRVAEIQGGINTNARAGKRKSKFEVLIGKLRFEVKKSKALQNIRKAFVPLQKMYNSFWRLCVR